MDDEFIRCPACRGRKRVEKLGGVIGDCNMCSATGTISLKDKPGPAVAVVETDTSSVIDAVARVAPNQIDDVKPAGIAKRAVFKRKAG